MVIEALYFLTILQTILTSESRQGYGNSPTMFFTTNTKILEYRRMATWKKVSAMHYLGINFFQPLSNGIVRQRNLYDQRFIWSPGFDVLLFKPVDLYPPA